MDGVGVSTLVRTVTESTRSLVFFAHLAVLVTAVFTTLLTTHSVLSVVAAALLTLVVTRSLETGTSRKSEQAERAELREPPSG